MEDITNEQRKQKRKYDKKYYMKHLVRIRSLARYVVGLWFQMVLEVTIEIIVQTVCRAFIWIINREIVHLNVMESWTLSGFGSEQEEEWAVIHRCRICGKIVSNRVAADDNPMKLMALAMKPFGSERISQKSINKLTISMEG